VWPGFATNKQSWKAKEQSPSSLASSASQLGFEALHSSHGLSGSSVKRGWAEHPRGCSELLHRVLHNSTLQNLQVSLVASEIPLPKRFTTSLSVYPSSLRACEKCRVHLALLQPRRDTRKQFRNSSSTFLFPFASRMTEQNQKQARCKTLSGTSPNLPLGTYLVRKSAIRARSRFAEAECARALRCRVWCALGCFVSRHLNPQARCSSSSAPQSHMYEVFSLHSFIVYHHFLFP